MSTGPHDSVFRAIFEQLEHARGALRSMVPGWVAEALDWSSLARESGSFIDPDLVGRQSDLLFQLGWRDGGAALVYMLFEHQSTSDRFMAFRLLRYMIRIWERWMRDFPTAKRLPVIVPVVLYHGEEAWSAPLTLEALLDVPATEQAWVHAWPLQFRYVLDDLSEITDQQLRKRAMTALGRFALGCLKHARTDADLIEILEGWADVICEAFATPQAVEALRLVMRYILRVNDHVKRETLGPFMGRVAGPEAEDIVMTAGDELIQEGIEKGIEKGERRMLLRFLRMRFGGAVDAAIESRVAAASERRIDRWVERMQSPSLSLAEVLAD